MKRDKDLDPVLERASKDELDIIVQLLLASSGEELSKDEYYKAFTPDHTRYTLSISGEIRRRGGSAFVKLFPGLSPDYKEMARNLANKMHAEIKGGMSAAELEAAILKKLAESAWKGMSEKERASLLESLGAPSSEVPDHLVLLRLLETDPKALLRLSGCITHSLMGALGQLFPNPLYPPLLYGPFLPMPFPIDIFLRIYKALIAPDLKVVLPCVLLVATLRRKQELPAA